MNGKITTGDPTYNTATKVFSQTMEFTAPRPIGGEAVQIIIDHAANVFRGVLLTSYGRLSMWTRCRAMTSGQVS